MGFWQAEAGLAAVVALVRGARLAEAEAALAPLGPEHRAAVALLRGAIAARRGDLERALSETGRAVQLALEEGEALAALACVQLALGRPAFARPPAERAARLAADCAAGHASLAAAQQRNLEEEAALAAVRGAAVAAAIANGRRADTPGFRAIAGALGERLMKAGQEERARPFQAAARPA